MTMMMMMMMMMVMLPVLVMAMVIVMVETRFADVVLSVVVAVSLLGLRVGYDTRLCCHRLYVDGLNHFVSSYRTTIPNPVDNFTMPADHGECDSSSSDEPPGGYACEVCYGFARAPFVSCIFCQESPSWHHSRCCSQAVAESDEDGEDSDCKEEERGEKFKVVGDEEMRDEEEDDEEKLQSEQPRQLGARLEDVRHEMRRLYQDPEMNHIVHDFLGPEVEGHQNRVKSLFKTPDATPVWQATHLAKVQAEVQAEACGDETASGDETELGDEADHDYDYGWDAQQFKAYRRPLSSKGKVLGTVEFCVGLDILKFVWVYETLYFCCCHLILLLISNWLVIAVGNTVKGKRGRDGPVLC
jgi:hypothetical protein